MNNIVDLAIIGGGINGCGIARDAAGRGLSVYLCEQGDLAQATSSASTKLFHGGLRYLEYYKFRLVREALIEREILLRAMPHISWPLRFVLPHHHSMRPSWFLRLGLFIYDHLGGREILPGTKTLDLTQDVAGEPLKDCFKTGFEYSDCWVEDSRLVMLNARDAASNGAVIKTHSRCLSAQRTGDTWNLSVEDTNSGATEIVQARVLVNAAGPWVGDIIQNQAHLNSTERVRLVRGSHIVVRKMFDHDRAYIFQQSDGRIIFAIPYEQAYTLIGTTDQDHEGDLAQVNCSDEETDYLLSAASEYFSRELRSEDVVWTFSGVRPLYDDGVSAASQATRDYVLKIDVVDEKMPILNVFGGKITTYRRLAEAALEKLAPYFPGLKKPWTALAPLPGGNFPVEERSNLVGKLGNDYPFLPRADVARLFRHYGLDAWEVLGNAKSTDDLGRFFGGGLSEREVCWQIENEFVYCADDVVWRRTKQGLEMSAEEISALDLWIRNKRNA
jgi:glycerol-3-phosphate dehydrogenase